MVPCVNRWNNPRTVIRSRPTPNAQQRVQRPVGTRQFSVREAAGTGEDPDDKRCEGVGQRDGVGAGQLPGQMRLHLLGEPALFQKGDETGQPAERRYRAGCLREFDFGFSKKWRYNWVHRSVPF